MHITLLPSIPNYKSREFIAMKAITINAFGILFDSEARGRVVAVDNSRHFRCWVCDCTFYSGV